MAEWVGGIEFMRKQLVVAVAAVLLIGVSAAVIYRTQFEAASPEATRLPEGVGMVAAEEGVRLAGAGGKVLLILPKRGSYQDPAVEIQRAAFAKGFEQGGKVTLLPVEWLETERPGTMGAGGVDAGEFLGIIRRHGEAKVVVTLTGFPELSADALAELRGKKFVMTGTRGAQLKRLLETDVVQVAIVPRVNPVATTDRPKSAREWFRRSYEVVTAANANALP